MVIKNKVRMLIVCILAGICILGRNRSDILGAEMTQSYPETQNNESAGQLSAGWQEINGRRYYFFPQTGQMAEGWQEIDGESYYFQLGTGELSAGCMELEDGVYYFSPETGVMLTGWQETDEGRRYFSPSSGRMTTGWQKIGGKRYYFSKSSGRILTGLQKIDGETYIFDSKGRLAESDDTSLVTIGSSIYCADRNGKAAGGWHLIGKKLYYASKNGKIKRNTIYQGITFNSKGAAKDDDNSRLKIKVMQTVNAITDESMTKGQKLHACWSYVVGGKFRYAVKYPDLNEPGWQRQTACHMLSAGSGNCYGFACAFAALAEEIGYQPYIVCGRVRGSRDQAADGYTRHAWVRIHGLYYDPEAQFAGWRKGIYGWKSYPVSHTVQKILAF